MKRSARLTRLREELRYWQTMYRRDRRSFLAAEKKVKEIGAKMRQEQKRLSDGRNPKTHLR